MIHKYSTMFKIFLILINIAGFIAMGADKKKALAHSRRTREGTLFILALLGGSAGVWVGMYFFRHKTRHPQFFVGIPVIILIQLVILYFVSTGVLTLYADFLT